MTTAEQARKHFDEVVVSLSVQEFNNLERMTPRAKADYIAQRYQRNKRKELQTLKDKLRSQRGREAKQTRMQIVDVMKQVHE